MTADEFKALVSEPLDWDKINLSFHEEPTGLFHVTADIRLDGQKECLLAAGTVLNAVKGKTAFIRIPPEASSDRDIVRDVWLHCGYVRFSFKDEPGVWRYSEKQKETPEFLGFGARR